MKRIVQRTVSKREAINARCLVETVLVLSRPTRPTLCGVMWDVRGLAATRVRYKNSLSER